VRRKNNNAIYGAIALIVWLGYYITTGNLFPSSMNEFVNAMIMPITLVIIIVGSVFGLIMLYHYNKEHHLIGFNRDENGKIK
jgi:hypothetical protein